MHFWLLLLGLSDLCNSIWVFGSARLVRKAERVEEGRRCLSTVDAENEVV